MVDSLTSNDYDTITYNNHHGSASKICRQKNGFDPKPRIETSVEGLVAMGALETRLLVEGQMPLVLVLVSKSFGTNFAENGLHFEMD